jgi:outer membrane cobalamin receptor
MKKIILKRIASYSLALVLTTGPTLKALAATDDQNNQGEQSLSELLGDLSLSELFNLKVMIASKTGTSMSKVPAAITIITKEQIENTPARYRRSACRLCSRCNVYPS